MGATHIRSVPGFDWSVVSAGLIVRCQFVPYARITMWWGTVCTHNAQGIGCLCIRMGEVKSHARQRAVVVVCD